MDSQVKDIKTLFNTLFKTFLPTKCIFPKKVLSNKTLPRTVCHFIYHQYT